MRIHKVGEKWSKILKIDVHLELPTPAFNKMCTLWGKKPSTTEEFYELYSGSDTAEILTMPGVIQHAQKLEAWAHGFKQQLDKHRLIEVGEKKDKCADMTALHLHLANEDKYFVAALTGILANPNTHLHMVNPNLVVKQAMEMAKACVNRAE